MYYNKLIIGALAAIAMSACVSEDKKTVNEWLPEFNNFNAEGYWTDCYNTDADHVDINGFNFTHHAEVTVWDGVSYGSWYGFCPSKSTDTADYTVKQHILERSVSHVFSDYR